MLTKCNDNNLREKIRKQIFKLINCGDFNKLAVAGNKGKDGVPGAGIIIERLTDIDIILTSLNSLVSKKIINISMNIPKEGLFFTTLKVFGNIINGVIFDLGDKYLFQLFNIIPGGSLNLKKDPIFTYSFSSPLETFIVNDLVFNSPLGSTFYHASGTLSYSNGFSLTNSDIILIGDNHSNVYVIKANDKQFHVTLTYGLNEITFDAILLGVYSEGISLPIIVKPTRSAKALIPILYNF